MTKEQADQALEQVIAEDLNFYSSSSDNFEL